MMGYKYVLMTISKLECLDGQNGPALRGLKISQNFEVFMKYIQFPKP